MTSLTMKRLSFLIIAAIALLCNCGRVGPHGRLAEVDSLITHYQIDSAYVRLNDLSLADILTEGDRAYYGVLKSEALRLSHLSSTRVVRDDYDSLLNRSLDYYAKHDDPRNLARAHLCKGNRLVGGNKLGEGIHPLKEAERLLPRFDDLRLHYQTYEALATANYYSNNRDLALDYSYKTLDCAQRRGDAHMLIYAYNHLSVLYFDRRETDSTNHYMSLSMALIDQMPDLDKSYAYGNLGSVYLLGGDTTMAIQYYERAYEARPSMRLHNDLALIEWNRGDRQQAETRWAEVLDSGSLPEKVATYSNMMNFYAADGDYRRALDAARNLIDTKDSLLMHQQTEAVKEMQLKYDKEVEQRKLDRVVLTSVAGFFVLLLVIAAIVMYHYHKVQRARQQMMQAQMLIADYNRQVEQLEKQGKEAEKDIRQLKQKVEHIKNEQLGKLFDGRALYGKIVDGGTVVAWKNDDFQKFIEYYKLIDLPFVLSMDSDYTRLSPSNRFFLILQHMGMSDAEMEHILGVSNGALRTTRSRLRAKLTANAATNAKQPI